jgi:uncharacterized membrane protein (DUF4010 family)
MSVSTELEAAVRLGIAALIGLGVGLEREWSGHASGPGARFAGLRTFLLLAIVGGAAGLLLSLGALIAGALAIAGGMALGVSAYVMAARRPQSDVDGTTEAAALAVVALGALAGSGWLTLAAGTGSVVVLALSEKTRLHWLVGRVGETELRAALQFAVLALVVLPLLPAGPLGGALAFRPRALWAIVLFFSALNFAGYLARRVVGPTAGYTLTGVLGGIMSSTGVTLDFARTSRRERDLGTPLALGVIGACTMLIPRIVVVSLLLNPNVGLRIAWLLWPAATCGAAWLVVALRKKRDTESVAGSPPKSPLRLRAAIQMAVMFQIALSGIALVQAQWGAAGLYPTAAALGLTDVDALTVSMSRLAGGVTSDMAAKAVVIGVLANTLLKMGLATGIGVGQFRRLAMLGLATLAVAAAAGLLFPALPVGIL